LSLRLVRNPSEKERFPISGNDKNVNIINAFILATLKTKNIHTEYLEDYLLDSNYPYQAKGFDIPNRREIPVPSRFDRIFRIPNPEYQSRLLMLKKYLNNSVGEDTLQEIALATEDFSMAYLKELYIYSAMIALEKGNEVPSKGDLLQALEILKCQLKNGCKPFDKIGSQKVGFSAKV